MAINFKSVWEGLKIRAKSVLTSDEVGEIEVSSVDNKTYLHNGSTRSPVVTEAHPATLTYKTIDANGTGNSISNLETADLAAGVLNTSTTLAAASNTQVPSALAVKTYVDNGLAAQNQASEITYNNTTSGLVATNVQAAIDEVDADLTAHIGDTIDAHDASAISNIPSGNLVATDVQSALNELQSDVDTRATSTALSAHTGASSGVHGVVGSVVGTSDTQILSNKTLNNSSVIEVKDTNLTIQDDLDTTKQVKFQASGISTATTRIISIPNSDGTILLDVGNQVVTNKTIVVSNNTITTAASGNLTSTELNAALSELQLDIDTRATSISLNDHITDTVDAHDASAISSIPTGNLAATDVQAALNELDTEKAKTNGDLANSFSVLRTEVATATDAATTGTNASLAAFTQGIIRLTNASLVSLANIPAGNSGQQLEIVNRTGKQISIVDSASAVGTAANRILTGAAANINLAVDASLLLEYDATSARWQIIGGSGSGSGIATSAIDDNFAIVDASDATKRLTFNVSGTTGTTTTLFTNQTANRLITIPDATDTVVVETLPQTLTNKTLSGASIQSPTRLDPKKDTEANLITYAATAQDGELCFSTDSEEFFQVKNGQLIPVIVPNDNELTNSGFQSTPVTYGWTISNATASANTANPFKGTQSLSLALTGALSLSQSSTINAAQKSGVQMVASIWVNSSDVSDLQLCSLKNGSEDKCTVTGGYVQGSGWRQLTVSFLGDSTSNGLKLKSTDTTGTVLVDQAFVGIGSPIVDFTPDMVYSAAIGSTGVVSQENTDFIDGNCAVASNVFTCNFKAGTFSVDPNCVITAEVGATGGIGYSIDGISSTAIVYRTYTTTTAAASAQPVSMICQKQGADYKTSKAYVASSSDYGWTAYTPTFTGIGTPTNVSFFHKRVGDTLYIQGYATTGTVAASGMSISLPNSLTIDTAKIPTGSSYVGSWARAATNAADYGTVLAFSTATSALYFGREAVGSFTALDGNAVIASSEKFSLFAAVPINGWTNSSVIVGSFQGYNETQGVSNPKMCSFFVSNAIDVENVCSSATCVTQKIKGNCATSTSVTRSGSGRYTYTFPSNYWTDPTNVNCTVQLVVGGSGRLLPSTNSLSSTIRSISFDDSSAAGTDASFTVICHGN